MPKLRGQELLTVVQGAIIAALLGLLAGTVLQRSSSGALEKRTESTELRRTVYAVARAHMLVVP